MPIWLTSLFSHHFMPHGYCYLWNPGMVWLHVISDGLIALSYFCIPLALAYLVRQRRDLPFDWVFWMFAAFILGCGTTHLMEVWTIWHPAYLLSGMIKAFTAAISLLTAIMLVPLIPKAVALPSPTHLQELNLELQAQIEQRKQVESSLQKSLIATNQRTIQLEEANNELETFTYSISHDLRAPLRHVAGFSHILAKEYRESLPAEARQYLTHIQEGTQRMGLLIDEMLNLARVGRHDLRVRPTDLNAIIDEIRAILHPECSGRTIQWRVAQLPSCNCDQVLIKQVLQNLLSNAIKFTGTRERALIEIGTEERDGRQVIFVRDNGVGFDMKYADKLFGVFQRLHRAEEFEGTGIGLATVKRIIHRHGGEIWAHSEHGIGTTFFFWLEPSTRTGSNHSSSTASAAV